MKVVLKLKSSIPVFKSSAHFINQLAEKAKQLIRSATWLPDNDNINSNLFGYTIYAIQKVSHPFTCFIQTALKVDWTNTLMLV